MVFLVFHQTQQTTFGRAVTKTLVWTQTQTGRILFGTASLVEFTVGALGAGRWAVTDAARRWTVTAGNAGRWAGSAARSKWQTVKDARGRWLG
jgi:hypothetical protein